MNKELLNTEQIQSLVNRYLKQRNYSLMQKHNDRERTTLDLTKMLYIENISSIESTINDYYLYSPSTPIQINDYLKQFRVLTYFVLKQEGNNDLKKILFPIFVYICIDLVRFGHSIAELLEFWHSLDLNDKTNEAIIEDLKKFNKNKDINFSQKLSSFKLNKYKVDLNSKNWSKLIKFFEKYNTHLLYGLLNVNFAIKLNDADEGQVFKMDCINEKLIKKEKIEVNLGDLSDKLNLINLHRCIDKIKNTTPTLNAICGYYISDTEDCVTNVNISPNLEYISCTNEQSTINLYKIRNSKTHSNTKQLINGHSSVIFKSKFTHDSNYLLSCGADNLACLWNLNIDAEIDANLICKYSSHLYPVWDIDLYSKLNLFTTCSKDSTTRLWSFDRLYPLRIYNGHYSDVNCVAFHPNGSYLATGSSDKTIRFWSIQSGDFLRLFLGHTDNVRCVCFSPDGKYLISTSDDKSVKIWNIEMGSLLKNLGDVGCGNSILFDNTGSILCVGMCDQLLYWDFDKLRTTETNEPFHRQPTKFQISTVYCDAQNVFYALGKQYCKTSQQQLPQQMQLLNDDNDTTIIDVVNDDSTKTSTTTTTPIKTEPLIRMDRKKPTSLTRNLLKEDKYLINTRRGSSSGSTSTSVPANQAASAAATSSFASIISKHDDLYEF